MRRPYPAVYSRAAVERIIDHNIGGIRSQHACSLLENEIQRNVQVEAGGNYRIDCPQGVEIFKLAFYPRFSALAFGDILRSR